MKMNKVIAVVQVSKSEIVQGYRVESTNIRYVIVEITFLTVVRAEIHRTRKREFSP